MPIHTAIGPKPHTRQRYMHRLTRQSHIVQQDTIMENFTSPAARSPYGGMKDGTQQIGLTIVIKVIISKPCTGRFHSGKHCNGLCEYENNQTAGNDYDLRHQ